MTIEKYLLALKCLLAAAALDKTHPKVHEHIVRFQLVLTQDSETLSPTAKSIIDSEFTLLPSSVDLAVYNNEYLSANISSARSALSALKVRKLLQPESAPAVAKDVAAVIELPSISFDEASDALQLLQVWKSGEVEGFKSAAAKKWPHATIFSSSSAPKSIVLPLR